MGTLKKTLIIGVALVACLPLIIFVAFVWLRIQQLSVHDHVSVGMSMQDVRQLMGKPDRVTDKGDRLDPPHVSGFTPDQQNESVVWVYEWYNRFVYVYFDKNGYVKVYYSLQR